MSTQELTSLACDYIQVWSAGQTHRLDALADANLVVEYTHFPAPIQGIDSFKAVLHQTHTSFPDLALTVQEVISADPHVTIRWSYRGTHRQGEVLGIPPKGQVVETWGISILTINRGKVTAEMGIVDNFSLLQQLQSSN